uniref:3-hydroxyacyl-CoA dehydrogenase NAD binding domain-containing protein n=1 Tax=Ditylenchus dipsaci TaxID=166011 RepID=A0A915DEL4_9BILA
MSLRVPHWDQCIKIDDYRLRTHGQWNRQVSAQKQMNVILVGRNQATLDKAQKGIKRVRRSIARVAKKSIKVMLIPRKLGRRADLVIEAIVEDLDAKQGLSCSLRWMPLRAMPSSRPTLLLSSWQTSAGISSVSKLGGLHCFNPVPVMKLLEVVRHNDTSDETFNKLIEYGKNIGKKLYLARIRLDLSSPPLGSLHLRSCSMYERGDASKETLTKR